MSDRRGRPQHQHDPESASSPLPVQPELIESEADFRRAVGGLAGDWLALDTEFIGEKFYQPRLEVLQIASADRILIVDVPRVGDMGALKGPLADARIEKIFHAGSQDVELLRRATGVAPANVFDTQLAAAFLGHGLQVSLVNLAHSVGGVRMDGRHTTSDWSARPLSREQVEYAARDVAWLGAIRDRLKGDLVARGRLAWFQEEQTRRTTEAGNVVEVPDAEQYLRVRSGKPLHPREQAILRELAIWREETARRLDVPRRALFPDEGLIEVAVHQPTSREEMAGLRKLPKGPAMRHSEAVIEVVKRAARIPKEQWPRIERSPRVEAPPPGVFEIAQAVLRTEAERHEIAPSLVANTSELTALVSARPEDRSKLDIDLLKGWRRELAGERLLALLDGRILVRVGPKGLQLAGGRDA